MIKSSELIDEINKVLQKYYPIEKSFNDIKVSTVKPNYYICLYLLLLVNINNNFSFKEILTYIYI